MRFKVKDSNNRETIKSNVTPKEREIIFPSRKSLLFDNQEVWLKKGDQLFDVTMGAYGAEVCEIVGCFLLRKISLIYNKEEIGLFRDDGLSVLRSNKQRNERTWYHYYLQSKNSQLSRPNLNQRPKNRKRKVEQLFNANLATNIGKFFLKVFKAL